MAKAFDDLPIIFGDPRQPKAIPPSDPKARREPFETKRSILPKGFVRRQGCLALPCDILFERDQAVKLRDGTTICTDIYRPAHTDTQCPAIVAWSPYGKDGGLGNQNLNDFPFRLGVPLRELSEFQKWEGPDPAYWVLHGYAVVNPDARGVGYSEGDIYTVGSQEAQDGADLVDWVGEREWCNGKVGMSGNSYLAVMQWHIAAQKPKHLAAIAPWEGFSDMFREGIMLGGVESKALLNFMHQVISLNAGPNSWENVVATALQRKAHGAYHLDKAADVENIDVPAYVVSSWSHAIHPYGTFRAFCRLRSPKWLRVHDSIEWPDYYGHVDRTDLHRFFDRYLKGVENGWEHTSPVRAHIIDTAKALPNTGETITAKAFPPGAEESRALMLFFDAARSALSTTYPTLSEARYSHPIGQIAFEHKFLNDTILFGPIEMQLALSLSGGATDADVFIYIEKVLSDGVRVGEQLVIPFEKGWQTSILSTLHWSRLAYSTTKGAHFSGPRGCIRLSRRCEDTANVVPGMPIMDMTKEPVTVPDEEVLVVRPPVVPVGMRFWKNERVRVRISAVDERALPPMDRATLTVESIEEMNKAGSVILHCGGEDSAKSSWVRLPELIGS